MLMNGFPQGSLISSILFNVYASGKFQPPFQQSYSKSLALLYSDESWKKEEISSKDQKKTCQVFASSKAQTEQDQKKNSTRFHLSNLEVLQWHLIFESMEF